MKKEWKIYEFEKCLEKIPRYNKIPKNKFLLKGNFPIISQEKDFINGYWDNFEDVIEVKKPVVIFGDHTKVVKLIDFNFVVGADGVKIFQPIDGINAEYLAFFLQNIQLDDLGYARHYRLLKQVNVPIPPLEEQRTIVAKLDQAFAAIDQAKANIEKNITNAKELFQSKLDQIFSQKGDGWEESTLGELCIFSQGIQRDVKLQREICGDNQVRFLRIVDFTQGNESPRYIDFPGEKYIISSDDVSLVRYGASTGFVCHGLAGALANNMFRVIPKSRIISNKFLKIYLESSIFQNVIKIKMNGAAMPAISFGMINNLIFPYPKSLENQQQIVTQLDQLQEQTNLLVTKYQQKLANLEELKKSILEKAFKGELS